MSLLKLWTVFPLCLSLSITHRSSWTPGLHVSQLHVSAFTCFTSHVISSSKIPLNPHGYISFLLLESFKDNNYYYSQEISWRPKSTMTILLTSVACVVTWWTSFIFVFHLLFVFNKLMFTGQVSVCLHCRIVFLRVSTGDFCVKCIQITRLSDEGGLNCHSLPLSPFLQPHTLIPSSALLPSSDFPDLPSSSHPPRL